MWFLLWSIAFLEVFCLISKHLRILKLIFLWLISRLIPLQLKNMVCIISIFSKLFGYANSQANVNFSECFTCNWKVYEFCGCWLHCSLYRQLMFNHVVLVLHILTVCLFVSSVSSWERIAKISHCNCKFVYSSLVLPFLTLHILIRKILSCIFPVN